MQGCHINYKITFLEPLRELNLQDNKITKITGRGGLAGERWKLGWSHCGGTREGNEASMHMTEKRPASFQLGDE